MSAASCNACSACLPACLSRRPFVFIWLIRRYTYGARASIKRWRWWPSLVMISSVTAVQNCAEPAQRPGSRSPPPQPDCLSPEPEEEDVGHCISSASPVSSPVIQHRQPYISTHSRRSYTSPAAVHTHAAGDFRFSPCEDVDSNSSVTDSFPSFSASLSSSRGNTMIYYPHHGFSEVSLLEGKREREREREGERY